MSTNISFVHSQMAPAPVGHYSQALRFGNLVFCSGQIGLDPYTGVLVSDDFDQQAEQVFKNLLIVVNTAGCTLQDVVRMDVFLTDLNDFEKFNEISEKWLGYHKPTRQTVQVPKLPKGAKVEVSLIVAVG